MSGAGWGFQKFNRRAQDWAIVGVAAWRRNGDAGVALVNMGSTPILATSVATALAGGASVADAAEQAAAEAEPQADLNASVEYRVHLAKVLTRRALEAASALAERGCARPRRTGCLLPATGSAGWAFLRAMAVIYLIAFLVAANQFRPLLGARGILPIPHFVRAVRFRRAPSLFHLHYSDRFFAGVAWTGVVIAALAVSGSRRPGAHRRVDARLGGAVGAVPVDRQRRPDLVRLRLGDAAARGRLPDDLPRAGRQRPTAR